GIVAKPSTKYNTCCKKCSRKLATKKPITVIQTINKLIIFLLLKRSVNDVLSLEYINSSLLCMHQTECFMTFHIAFVLPVAIDWYLVNIFLQIASCCLVKIHLHL